MRKQDLYGRGRECELSHVENGDIRGWTPTDEGEYWIDFNHKKTQMGDGTTFYIIDIIQEPFPDIDML